MDDAFDLLNPHDAQGFLRRFPVELRRRGEAFFRSGQVLDLVPEEPGSNYSAIVEDRGEHEVFLRYLEEDGWSGTCSCPQQTECEHMYAAMSALLAEYRTATVRGLSSSAPNAVGRLAQERWKQRAAGKSEGSELAERLQALVGRKLTRDELTFVRAVHNVYKRCCVSHSITYWDFQEMGLQLNDWSRLDIWPSFPQNEHEFWLYVANAAKERGRQIPRFMAPVTDFELIREKLSRWKRSREVESWKEKLRLAQNGPVALQVIAEGAVDLRLVLDQYQFRLEQKRSGWEHFEPLKPTPFNQLLRLDEQGLVSLTLEAELLLRVFQTQQYGAEASARYDDSDAPELLSRLLRMRLLDSRIVTTDGQPLERPSQPLRWELAAASDENDDYRLRLVQDDDAPAPPILAVLPGRPTLYLSHKALFCGPDAAPNVLEPTEENRIPAPAIESTAGVEFLRSLGLALPPALSQRVRTLSYEIAIVCELRPAFRGSDAEECQVNVLAEAPDGHRTTWTGSYWSDNRTPKASRRADEGQHIVVYDSTILQQVPALLEPLRLKPSAYGRALVSRVTRKFPQTFAAWLKTLPPQLRVHLKGELASFANADVAGRVKLDVTEAEIDWFDLRVGLDVADTTLTPGEIKLLLNAKGAYVRLKGKGWRRLQFDLSDEENERLARLGLNPAELSDEPQRLHALQLADEAAQKFLPEQQVQRIQRRASEIKARVNPALPEGVKAELRPYQLEGFHFLAYLSTNRFGGILADDMGLGKTLQALTWLIWLRDSRAGSAVETESNQAKTLPSADDIATSQDLPALVVCPKSVMDNWHAEGARFAPGLRIRAWSARDLPNFTSELPTADLHVLNYSQLRSLEETIRPIRWLALILDEGQYIKNPNSQTAQIARSLQAKHRLILSGTPIENRLMDLWSLMSFAMPGVLSSRAQFAKLYDAKGDPFARKRLAARVRPFVLRRTKAQVAKDLPERIEEDLFCEIEGEQETLYRAELKRAQQLLLGIRTQKELAQQQFHFLTSLLRLRQICCHPRLVRPDSTASSAKSEALLEQISPLMEEGQKVLVFSQFVELLNLLQPVLREQGWPVFYLAGQTENRGELVRQFQASEGAAVFLISLKAGGFGLNLTAASYVILFDPWWNPAVENQAIDRTHRIGQTNNVMAYRLLIKNSIEEKIRELQKQKKALAEDVLGEEKFAQSLTLQDLQFLFSE
jgi:hypothetical protein